MGPLRDQTATRQLNFILLITASLKETIIFANTCGQFKLNKLDSFLRELVFHQCLPDRDVCGGAPPEHLIPPGAAEDSDGHASPLSGGSHKQILVLG